MGFPKKKTRLKKWYSFRKKKHAFFITFWGEGVQHPKVIMIDAFFKPFLI